MRLAPRQPLATADASRGVLTARLFWKTVIGFAIFLVAAYLLLGLLGWGIGMVFPDSWEKKIALSSFLEDDLSEEDSPELARLRGILQELSQGETLRDLNYQVWLIESEEPNAFAVPGGAIFVTTELIEVVPSDTGLAFVLAHELGHHEERHLVKGLSRSTLFHISAQLAGFGGNGTGLVEQMLANGHSRNAEYEADAYAIDLVDRHYDELEGALEFFQWLTQKRQESRLQAYFQTHPVTKERLRRIQEYIDTKQALQNG